MNTAFKTQTEFLSVTITERTKTISWFTQLMEDFETNRFGIAPMLLVAMACLGGIASAFAVQGSEIKLMSVAVSTSMVEILIIALSPARMITVACVIAFLVDLFVFIF